MLEVGTTFYERSTTFVVLKFVFSETEKIKYNKCCTLTIDVYMCIVLCCCKVKAVVVLK